MPLTPETLTRHELVGLPVRVAAAPNPDLTGTYGRVASETMRTLVVRGPAEGAANDASLPTHEAGTADDASASESVDDASAASTDSDVRDRRVPKRGVTFEFALPGDSSQTATGATPEADATATGATPDSVTTAVGACVPPLSGRATGDPSTAGRGGASAPASGSTDEAAGERKPPGSASELPWETPGTGSTRPAGKSGGCEGAVYVTVDGEQLLSRPAFRAERAGDTTWQSD